jgi:hypothetical protein
MRGLLTFLFSPAVRFCAVGDFSKSWKIKGWIEKRALYLQLEFRYNDLNYVSALT